MKPTPRQRQIAEALDTRKRQVEEALEHQRFDVRVQRGEWPTEKVGELFGNPIYRIDGAVPLLALMASSHGTVMFYESRILGAPQAVAQGLLVECAIQAWPDIRQQFFVSGKGWVKLKRSIASHDKVNVGIDFGADGSPSTSFTTMTSETYTEWRAGGR